MPVPSSVLAAWGLRAPASPLEGGQGRSVRVGDGVLKPHASDEFVQWYAGLCARVTSPAFRLPAVVPALDGRLVVEGWTATAYTPGAPVHDDDTSAEAWLPVLAAGRAFHTAVVDEPCPSFLAARTHRWAVADRVAWGEAKATSVGERSRPLLTDASSLVVDDGLPAQLVHGDLSGNVLLAGSAAPSIIDVSPYWRPAAYADAVVVMDALLWWRTDPAVIELGRPDGVDGSLWRSLLARAFVFRLLAFDEPNRDADEVDDQLPRYAETLALL
ncbi:MAG: hypothetical protein U0R68_15730 [Candidatus Nanopelagicales bacterium]